MTPYKNREDMVQHHRRYYHENKERENRLRKERLRRQRRKVIELLGGKCVRCGCTDWRVLQVNHINGKGSQERRKKGSWGIYREILNGKRSIDDLDLRCANCNILYEYGEK